MRPSRSRAEAAAPGRVGNEAVCAARADVRVHAGAVRRAIGGLPALVRRWRRQTASTGRVAAHGAVAALPRRAVGVVQAAARRRLCLAGCAARGIARPDHLFGETVAAELGAVARLMRQAVPRLVAAPGGRARAARPEHARCFVCEVAPRQVSDAHAAVAVGEAASRRDAAGARAASRTRAAGGATGARRSVRAAIGSDTRRSRAAARGEAQCGGGDERERSQGFLREGRDERSASRRGAPAARSCRAWAGLR